MKVVNNGLWEEASKTPWFKDFESVTNSMQQWYNTSTSPTIVTTRSLNRRTGDREINAFVEATVAELYNTYD